MSNRNDNWKFQTYVRGSLIGMAVGIVAAYLYTRAAEEYQLTDGKDKLTPIGASDMVKISLSILALVRQITELGSSASSK